MRAFPVLLVLLLAAPSRQQDVFPRIITSDGRLTRADYERHIEREFQVPAGTRRVERRRQTQHLCLGASRHARVPAGPIEPGAWAVLLGFPNIRDGSNDRYQVTVRLFDTDLPPVTRVIRPGPGWYAGDLHAHSGHGDGRALSLSKAATPTPAHRMFDAAAAAGLDFVLLSDHNTASHWLDVDRLQPYYDSLLLLHGREVTTYRGHANTVGETAFHDFRLPRPDATPAGLLATIRANGAFISINHPLRPDDETCMGCGWNVDDAATIGQVHGVEVVNGALRDGSLDGWAFWARLLNRGHRLTAVGGSDEHTVDAPMDQNLGTPATVVYARELSEAGIVDGLKSGRVYIRTQHPRGPALEFSAESGGAVYQMGDTIPSAPPRGVTLQVQLWGADGQNVEWIRKGEPFAAQPVGAGGVRRLVEARDGDWFSVVVRDAAGRVTVFANAIYIGRR